MGSNRQTILAVATGPLLGPGAKVFSGQCLRTWHFVAPLLAAGHNVHLYTIPIPGATEDEGPITRGAEYKGFEYTTFLVNDEGRVLPELAAAIETHKPTVLLGINAYPAFLLAKLNRPEPFWADLNGWTLAEGQVRAAALSHDREFGHFWRLEALTLLGADRYSTCSDRQADALFGELAMLGRLDHRTVADPFAVGVPNAVHPDFATLRRTLQPPAVLSGKVPPDSLICLWSGGFNSWTDVDVLTAGLAEAMQREPILHFVATGGPIIGHDEVTYRRFTEFAEKRFPKGRCHLLGWVDYQTMLELHSFANVGLNLDGINIETRFGARNRLTNMLGAGLPVITTLGTEISYWIESNKVGATIRTSDVAGLAIALVQSIRESTAWRLRGARARAKALQDFSPQATVEPLLRWMERPRHASDRIPGLATTDHYSSTARLRHWVRQKCDEPQPFAAPAPSSTEVPIAAPSRSHSGMFRLPGQDTNGSSTASTGLWDLLKASVRGKK